jgi:hypothetical protein
MYATTARKDNQKTTIVLPPLPPWEVAKGHQQHRGGAGTHADRRTNRQRTRATQQRAALSDD